MPLKNIGFNSLLFHLSRKEIITAWGIVLGIFTLLILYAFEIRRFENMIEPLGLVKWSLTYGAVFAGLVATYYVQKIDELVEQLKVFIFIFVSLLLFMPLFGSLLNRYGSYQSIEQKRYEIFEVEKIELSEQNQTLKPKESDYFIFVFENEKLERIRLRNRLPAPVKGEQIALEKHRGLLGWDWLEESKNRIN